MYLSTCHAPRGSSGSEFKCSAFSSSLLFRQAALGLRLRSIKGLVYEHWINERHVPLTCNSKLLMTATA